MSFSDSGDDSKSQHAGSDVNQFTLSTQNSYDANFILPTEVLETLTNYSVSSPGGWLSDEIRMHSFTLQALEDEFRDDIALQNESPGSARVVQLQALVERQRSRLDKFELDIAAYSQHQTVAENANSALADRIAGITTAHVLVCLERDRLRRFIRVGVCVLVILVIVILLLGFRVYVRRILHTR